LINAALASHLREFPRTGRSRLLIYGGMKTMCIDDAMDKTMWSHGVREQSRGSHVWTDEHRIVLAYAVCATILWQGGSI
jgi:hypothetical protein